MSGYARAHRGRWDHPLFKSKQEAAVWAWMTDTARFKAHSFQTRFGIVQLERGQLLASQRTIADDFGLGRQQVRRLVDSMVKAGMIAENSTHAASRAGTIITIINYERYQADSEAEQRVPTQRQPKRQPITNPRPTHDQPTREKGGKGEEREEGKEERPSVSSTGKPADPEADGSKGALIPFPSPASPSPADPVRHAFDEFDALRRECLGGTRNIALDEDRRRKLTARLDDVGGTAGWADVLAAIRASPFLRGEKTGRPVATIDWILNPTNLRKIREGNYADERSPILAARGAGASAGDAMRAARAAVGLGGPRVRQ